MTIFIIFLMLGLMLIGVPVVFSIMIATLLFFIVEPSVTIEVFIQRIISGTQSFPLLAIPFFVLTGYLMNVSDISRRLINLSSASIGHIKGGIGYVNILVNTFMAGMSGSSNADSAVLSKLLVTPMEEKGYSRGLAAGLTASASLIAPIIPPSIALIMYGFMAEVSIGKLFMAGILPGILMAVLLFIFNFVIARKNDLPKEHENFSIGEVARTFKYAVLALFTPVIIVGGIRLGIMTPTEAGAITVVYAFLIGYFVYKKITMKMLKEVIGESVTLTAVVMIIVAASSAFGWVLTWERIPQQVAELVLGLSENPIIVLLLINIMLLIIGMFIEGTASIVLLTPLLTPLVAEIGVDLVHFGIIVAMNLAIGSITPPLGTVMFTTSAAANISIVEFLRKSWPLYIVLLIALFMVTYIPAISLALVK
ncbi:TRAP transporter large permease [Sporosarcina sp. FSL W7-1349]|uniref:TRAP transporter large permease n=1 Tax=Sporosarcina sp. FSL W7-1349 TaxID=2921561 RepID=UPI0030FC3C60